MCKIRDLTKEEVIKLAQESSSIREIFKKIGIESISTYYYKVFKSHCKELNLDLPYFINHTERNKRQNFSGAEIVEAVNKTRSCRELLDLLNLNPTSGQSYNWFNRKKKELNLDTSHWITPKEKIKQAIYKNTIPLEEILIKNSTYLNTGSLKKKLLKAKMLINKCAECSITQWKGKELSLQLDHINGISDDNRIENLRLLCPNCHSQTDTFCGKNQSPARANDALDFKCNLTEKNFCKTCNKRISLNSNFCKSCVKKPTKITWPPDEALLQMIKNTNFSAVSRELGVSDTAIRKRLKTKGLLKEKDPIAA